MKSGIIGARGVGKSTIFHALTGFAPISGAADTRNRARFGQIKVSDPRLDFLEQAYGSRKKVPVELTLLDFAPNPKEQKEGAALDPSLLPLIRDLDALLLVLPEFAGHNVPIVAAIENIEGELVFADFDQAERRLERLKKEKGQVEFERNALEKCLRWLEQGKPLRTLDLTAQEVQTFSSFGFLSRKPALAVINCDPDQATALNDNLEIFHTRGLESFRLAAAFEAELWELDADGRRELLAEAGIEAPARDRLVSALYGSLGLITFYTAGEPEAHAWQLRSGASALEAADRIHSDIARGFIRAEVVSYEDFAALGSDARVKEAGKLRLEGRDYVMRDGDIIHVRFKV
ncbi:MAG: redox-regulated ATPase YchF [Deltaproteobacteria bacterium]|nr:redox-regulated ATPase YchF [Deltaproteobacteria bacterium]